MGGKRVVAIGPPGREYGHTRQRVPFGGGQGEEVCHSAEG